MGVMSFERGGYEVESSSLVDVASGSSNAYGSWTELVASTTAHTTSLGLGTYYPTQNVMAIDIGIGGSGSEVVLVEGLVKDDGNDVFRETVEFHVPVVIPKGVRVSIRVKSVVSTSVGNYRGRVRLYASPLNSYGGYQVVEKFGWTDYDPGGTADTKGSYVELSSSLAATYEKVMIGFDNRGDTTKSNYSWKVYLAIGAASSELDVIDSVRVSTWGSAGDIAQPAIHPWLPIRLQKGQRLSIAAECDGTDATNRKIGISVWGIR